jgi:hypothetical protein
MDKSEYILESNADLSVAPQDVSFDPSNKALAMGDLHGNTMKAIYFLIRYGVMTLKNPQDYQHLWEIYNTHQSQLTEQNFQTFYSLLDAAKFNMPKLITFIGDEFADRGNNDWFTMLLFKKLHDSGVPYQILLSNHGNLALSSFIQQKHPGNTIGYRQADEWFSQQTSLDNLWSLVNREMIDIPTISHYASLYYTPHLKLIAYTKINDDHLTLYTHGLVGLETVMGLCKKFNIAYNDSSIDNLMSCVDQINDNGISFIQTQQPEDGDPLNRLLWEYEIRLYIKIKPKGKFTINIVHGHIGEKDRSQHHEVFINLDTNTGKSPNHNTGKLIVWCEEVSNTFKSSLYSLKDAIYQLTQSSNAYLSHLNKSLNDPAAREKIVIIRQGLELLRQGNDIEAFFKLISEKQAVLEQRRDTATTTFLKSLAIWLARVSGFGVRTLSTHFFEKESVYGHQFSKEVSRYKNKIGQLFPETPEDKPHKRTR